MARPLLLIPLLALALAGCGDDDEDGSGTQTAERTATTETATAPERTTPRTETGGTTTERPNPRIATVSLAVTSLVEAVEQGDAASACRLLGQPGRGTDPSAIQTCASAAGVDLDRLPTSDELSIEDVKFTRRGAIVRLSGGGTMRLARSGRGYRVVDFTPARLGQP